MLAYNPKYLTPSTLEAILGGFPKTEPLELKILKEETFEDYTRKLVEYKITTEEKVQAYILIPKKVKKASGILAIHRDSEEFGYEFGKSEVCGIAGSKDQVYGIELCKRGNVVICPDRFPFESRRKEIKYASSEEEISSIFYDYKEEREINLSEDLYRGYVYNKMLLKGEAPLGKEIYELKRAIDVLYTLEEVDKKRIGVIGHKIGGLLGVFLMYLDDRVAVGCSSDGIASLKNIINEVRYKPVNGIANLFVVPGLILYGDVEDLLKGIAPRPFMEVRKEGSNHDEMKSIYENVRDRYMDLTAMEKFNYTFYENNEEFSDDIRHKCYYWFAKWFSKE